MDNYRSSVHILDILDMPHKGEDGVGEGGNAVVRPRSEVEVLQHVEIFSSLKECYYYRVYIVTL